METLEKLSDERLAVMLQSKCSAVDAFKVLKKRYNKKIIAYLWNKVIHVEDIDEIISEVFINLWEKRMCEMTNLRSFLFSTAKNKLSNTYRRRDVIKRYSYLTIMEDQAPSIESTIYCIEINKIIIEEISKMPQNIKVTMKLSIFKNWSLTRIAQKLDCSKRNIENYRSLGLKRLRNSLQEYIEYEQ